VGRRQRVVAAGEGEERVRPVRENWLSNRIFTSYPNILDHCCAAWNKLTDQPWLIMSIGLRDWAQGTDQWDLV
jgi:hypothetical protein